MDATQQLKDYFASLDLPVEAAELYLALFRHGPQTISQLARTAQVERTRIYRLLPLLQENALIEIETQYKRQILKAAPLNNLQILFSKKEQTLAQLQQNLPSLERLLKEGRAAASNTKVQFYHGAEGAKQILWNETRSQTEVLGLLYENIQIRTAEKFFSRWVERCNERGLQFRGVVGDEFLRSQEYWYGTHQTEGLQHWQARYLPREVLDITHSTIIYDDVVAYYAWKDDDIFGIEIYNPAIAAAQRQFFELLWDQAQPVPDAPKP